MKLIALLSAGALAVGSLVATAAPAEAQRYGYDGGYRHHRGDYRPDHHRGRYGYDRQRGYGRTRVVCRVHRGYRGPVRSCFRVHR